MPQSYELLDRAAHNNPFPDEHSTVSASQSKQFSTTSNDILQPNDSNTSTPKTKPSKLRTFKNGWLWEISGALLSISCAISIIIILISTNNKPLSSWHFFIRPNALISIFSTLSKAALMVPVAACISQLKWLYFDSPHRLHDLDVFDEASRGPWGSLELILRLRFRLGMLLATWGGVITIVALGIDPFAQQILSFPSRRVLSKGDVGREAYLGATQFYDTRIPIFSPTAKEVTADDYVVRYYPQANSTMAIAALNGLIDDTFAPTFNCPTAECHWPEQTSLAICSQCSDVLKTSKLSCPISKIDGNCTATTPKGVTFRLDTQFNAVASFPGNGSLKGNPPTLASINIYRDNSHQQNLYECSLSLCAKVFHNTIAINGKINTEKTVDFPLAPSNNGDNYLMPVTDPAVPMQHWYAYDVFTISTSATVFSGQNKTFTVNVQDRRSIASYLSDVFTMNNTNANLGIRRLLFNTPDIPGKLQNVSISMTNSIRKTDTSTGIGVEVYNQEAVIVVKWAWLILPLVVVCMSVVFLVFTIAESRRCGMPVWKSSALPLLWARLVGWDEGEMGGDGPTDLRKKAKLMSGRVINADDGNGLVFVKS
ncbi:hypothetical protein EJ08DRAFT_700649 [Tothia fuscella]|uniref:Uncharacterized protein n=1 Tax=Tothia fuscella TaxID=1048955 RepID=A0A9P4NKM2_9PEZI|nr:hypothetical protein EJ08DRAFT_700649 [Tothia fuscella]